jgi:hypothetical protein
MSSPVSISDHLPSIMGPPLQYIDPVDMQPMQLNASVSVAVTATFIQTALLLALQTAKQQRNRQMRTS